MPIASRWFLGVRSHGVLCYRMTVETTGTAVGSTPKTPNTSSCALSDTQIIDPARDSNQARQDGNNLFSFPLHDPQWLTEQEGVTAEQRLLIDTQFAAHAVTREAMRALLRRQLFEIVTMEHQQAALVGAMHKIRKLNSARAAASMPPKSGCAFSTMVRSRRYAISWTRP